MTVDFPDRKRAELGALKLSVDRCLRLIGGRGRVGCGIGEETSASRPR
jgi:hypothetical protein